jgi:capsid assembly protease
MSFAYPHIAERLFGHALAIEPFALRSIIDGPVGRRVLSGEKLEPKENKKLSKTKRARFYATANNEIVRSNDGIAEYALTDDGVAILSITGALSRRYDWLAAACGFATYDALGASLDAAMSDFRVRGVLLDVDSPGGEAAGMLDLADKIIAARADKPIWAVANAFAASAAYALAGSASRLVLPRLGQVGSIGSVIVHVDQSVQDEAMGLNYTAIYSGDRKIDGWAHAPLSAEAKDTFQADADHCRNAFAELIGRQGRMSAREALATQAEIYSDTEAVSMKLADAVATFDDTLAELTCSLSRNPGMTMAASAANNGERRMSNVEQATRSESSATTTTTAATIDANKVTELGPAAAKPGPGEKCKTCGQVMPDDADEDGLPRDTNSKATAGSAADGYTMEMAVETMDLCTIAKVQIAEAKAFVAAKTPIVSVRAALAKKAADETNANVVNGTAQPHEKGAQAVARDWDAVIAEQNERFAKSARR